MQLQPQQLMCNWMPHQPAARNGARSRAATGWVLGQEQPPQQKRHMVAPKLCSTAYFIIEQVGRCFGVQAALCASGSMVICMQRDGTGVQALPPGMCSAKNARAHGAGAKQQP